MAKILLLEDDFRLTEALLEFLSENSHEITLVKNVDQYNQALISESFHISILDSKLLLDIKYINKNENSILLIGPFEKEIEFNHLDSFKKIIRKPFDIDDLTVIIKNLIK